MAPPAVQTAVDKDGLYLPLIDFSLYLHGSENDKLDVAKGLADGFKNAGFVYIKNFGISDETLKKVFSESAKFFARPKEQKDLLSWTSPESNRGYVAQGREKVTSLTDPAEIAKLLAANPDLKETFEIGREGEDGHPNMFPDNLDEDGEEFTKTMKNFHTTCKNLHVQVMRGIGLGMGLDEHFFDQYTDAGDNTLRLLHYPSQRKDVFTKNKGQVRAGKHTDYITLLFQDSRGGLQVRSPQGTWVDATPIPGTCVINAGDLLARWSNDAIHSTEHQVIEPPSPPLGNEYPARYSIAYFCNPNFDKMIEALPGTYAEGMSAQEGGKKYQPVLSGDYLVHRLSQTFVVY